MINKVREIVKYWVNRNQNGGMPNGDEFSTLCTLAQINVINSHVKKEGVETYSYDADEIAYLKEVETATVTDNLAPRPTDFMYLLNIDYRYTYEVDGTVLSKYKEVDMLRDGELNRRLNSAITYPTTEYPMARWTKDGFEVYPDEVGSVRITFLKKPADPVWAYTLDGRGRPVYDELNSVDFTLPESMINEIALDILSQMGINVREAEVVQYANTLKAQE